MNLMLSLVKPLGLHKPCMPQAVQFIQFDNIASEKSRKCTFEKFSNEKSQVEIFEDQKTVYARILVHISTIFDSNITLKPLQIIFLDQKNIKFRPLFSFLSFLDTCSHALC